MRGWLLRSDQRPIIVRAYGRDSVLVWANLLLARLFAALCLRVGLRSDEQLRRRIEADTAAMRHRGYLVASVEPLTLPVIGARDATAHWYPVTFERTGPADHST